MTKRYLRGDIYFAELNDAGGSVQNGARPVLIVQNDIGNAHAPTVIVVPITSRGEFKPKLPTHIPLDNIARLKPGSVALVEQICTLDKANLKNQMCSLSSEGQLVMDAALIKSLGLYPKEKQAAMIMALCPRCSSFFNGSCAFNLHRSSYGQLSKEPCAICGNGFGYDYALSRVQGG